MKTQHTPGPWVYGIDEFDDWGIVRTESKIEGFRPVVCRARSPLLEQDYIDQCRASGKDPYEANARLIAAAPDLLEALQDMLAGWRYIRQVHGDLPGVGWDRAEIAAVAAIAKATGQ